MRRIKPGGPRRSLSISHANSSRVDQPVLPCGCVAGVYETYEGAVVTLLDEREATCQIRHSREREPHSRSRECLHLVKNSSSRRSSATALTDCKSSDFRHDVVAGLTLDGERVRREELDAAEDRPSELRLAVTQVFAVQSRLQE